MNTSPRTALEQFANPQRVFRTVFPKIDRMFVRGAVLESVPGHGGGGWSLVHAEVTLAGGGWGAPRSRPSAVAHCLLSARWRQSRSSA